MKDHFNIVKEFLLELEYTILHEEKTEELFIVEKQEAGITNLIIDCEDPILIIEAPLFELKSDKPKILKALLQKNREIIHGAFVLDETGQKVLFRDTLQLENLDLNELEGSLNSLELLLSEYAEDLLNFAKA